MQGSTEFTETLNRITIIALAIVIKTRGIADADHILYLQTMLEQIMATSQHTWSEKTLRYFPSLLRDALIGRIDKRGLTIQAWQQVHYCIYFSNIVKFFLFYGLVLLASIDIKKIYSFCRQKQLWFTNAPSFFHLPILHMLWHISVTVSLNTDNIYVLVHGYWCRGILKTSTVLTWYDSAYFFHFARKDCMWHSDHHDWIYLLRTNFFFAFF